MLVELTNVCGKAIEKTRKLIIFLNYLSICASIFFQLMTNWEWDITSWSPQRSDTKIDDFKTKLHVQKYSIKQMWVCTWKCCGLWRDPGSGLGESWCKFLEMFSWTVKNSGELVELWHTPDYSVKGEMKAWVSHFKVLNNAFLKLLNKVFWTL